MAVKVTDGPAGKTPRDAVHLYLDGRHDRGVTYDTDDLHLAVPRRGNPTFVRSHTPWWFLESKVSEAKGGYVVEIKIGSAYFLGKGIATAFRTGGVYGFDLAVDEGDKVVHRQTWRGNQRIDEDTSSFGTIVLTETGAIDGASKERP